MSQSASPSPTTIFGLEFMRENAWYTGKCACATARQTERRALRCRVCARHSMSQAQSMRHCMWEDVRVNQHDQPDDGAQRDRVPDHEAENLAFVADLIGCRRRNADRLRVDHLSHHAAGAVGGAHQYGIKSELLRRNPLQAAEESIGRRIATGESDAEPAQERSKERVEPPGACEGESQNGIKSGVARYIPQAEHEGDCDYGEAHAIHGVYEGAQQSPRIEAENETGNQCGEEASGARGREPVEIVLRSFRGGLCDYRSCPKYTVVQNRELPSAALKCRGGVAVDRGFHRRQPP